MAAPLQLSASGIADATGNVTVQCPQCPLGYVWDASFAVPAQGNTQTVWTVHNSTGLLGNFGGNAEGGPFRFLGGQTPSVTASGLAVGANVQVIITGNQYTTQEAPPQPPSNPQSGFPLPVIVQGQTMQASGYAHIAPAGTGLVVPAPPVGKKVSLGQVWIYPEGGPVTIEDTAGAVLGITGMGVENPSFDFQGAFVSSGLGVQAINNTAGSIDVTINYTYL